MSEKNNDEKTPQNEVTDAPEEVSAPQASDSAVENTANENSESVKAVSANLESENLESTEKSEPSSTSNVEEVKSEGEVKAAVKEEKVESKIERKKESNTENAKPSPQSETAGAQKTIVRYALWPSFLLLICIVGVGAGVGYLTLQGQQLIAAQDKQIDQLKTELAQQSASYQKEISSQSNKLRSEIKTIQKTTNTFKQDLDAAQQRLAAQGKRLRAMSDTSREDWLLAEAEYLLKLANQRVRIERSPQGADALISEADAILRELDQPDLHGIRREIAEDLAALRLMQKVDVEGIYLQLVALSQNIEKIPHRQPPQDKLLPEYPEVPSDSELSITQKLSNSWSRLVAEIKSHVKVSKHDVEIKPVLAAQDAFYLQQNLRLILERAQLALLREQQDIYSQSVEQAKEWIETYFPESNESKAFTQQLTSLSTLTVAQNLPDISDSLNALHEYIEALHDLKGASKPSAVKPKSTAPSKQPPVNTES